jgi:hypothetical protein
MQVIVLTTKYSGCSNQYNSPIKTQLLERLSNHPETTPRDWNLYAFGSKHCSCSIHTVARKNFTYIITSRGSGDIFPRFLYGGRSERDRQVGPLAPGIALRLLSYRCQESPLKGVWGETGVICVVHESVREKSCKCTANFFCSLTKPVLYVEIPAGTTSSCFKDQQFHKQLVNNAALTPNWRMEWGLRNLRPTSKPVQGN